MPVYAVPVVEEGGVEQPAVQPDVDDVAYNLHYRGDTVYVASRVQVDAFEENDDVEVVDDSSGAAAGTDEYPAPEASPTNSDDTDDDSSDDNE